nr:MAG: hypothetical protein H3Bulk42442_000001 [Mitovirus sp.]QDH91195.1 MAG: hypothetical protein H3Bulk412240_000001 [Mitovirus sp.]
MLIPRFGGMNRTVRGYHLRTSRLNLKLQARAFASLRWLLAWKIETGTQWGSERLGHTGIFRHQIQMNLRYECHPKEKS